MKLRLTANPASGAFGDAFDELFLERRREADEFYDAIAPEELTPDERMVQRQAFASAALEQAVLPLQRPALAARRSGRTRTTAGASARAQPAAGRISTTPTWFPCRTSGNTLGMRRGILRSIASRWRSIDPDFAKEQLLLLLREWYMHPNGQLPAYEWNFSDVNPPVHAWAVWRVYKIEEKHSGRRDRGFLERAFHKLLLNFTWWVNRKDSEGNNIFQGGFLGLDNVGVLDRSGVLPNGGVIEQSDATSWMGMYCLNMMTIALELSRENPAYEDVASKFLEHFVYISRAMNNIAGQGIELWDRTDRFYYDVLRLPDGKSLPMRVRSLVGLIPLLAVETLDSELIDTLPGFKRRMQYFIDNLPEFADYVETLTTPTNIRRFLSLVNRDRLASVLSLHVGRIGVSLAVRDPLALPLPSGSSLHAAARRN